MAISKKASSEGHLDVFGQERRKSILEEKRSQEAPRYNLWSKGGGKYKWSELKGKKKKNATRAFFVVVCFFKFCLKTLYGGQRKTRQDTERSSQHVTWREMLASSAAKWNYLIQPQNVPNKTAEESKREKGLGMTGSEEGRSLADTVNVISKMRGLVYTPDLLTPGRSLSRESS